MKATKYERMDHVLYNFEGLGDTNYMMADFYKACRTSFNEVRKTSKRLKNGNERNFLNARRKSIITEQQKADSVEKRNFVPHSKRSTSQRLVARRKAGDWDEGNIVRHGSLQKDRGSSWPTTGYLLQKWKQSFSLIIIQRHQLCQNKMTTVLEETD